MHMPKQNLQQKKMGTGKEPGTKKGATITLPKREALQKLMADGTHEDGVVEIFDQLMLFAYSERASDIHVEPLEKKSVIRIRVDGVLHNVFELPTVLHQQLIARLKILTRMRTDEHKAPQDGRFKFSAPNETVDVRASIIPINMGEKAVLRLLSSTSHQLTLEQLGLSETDLQRVNHAIRKPWGMILATGPTGSGKTTTIYSILEILNKREVNISTIEDPIEYEIEGVNQSQVDHAAKLTFATGLRSLLRQDPDIIMVGEIRDQETAKIAVNAAMTGHKLLSTLHTNDAATTIPRLIDLGAEPFLVASTLICAIAQRLVRRLCPDCKQTKVLTKAEAEKILSPEMTSALFKDVEQLTVGEIGGCEKCHSTGYKGRLGIFEVIENSPTLQELISNRAGRNAIYDQAVKEGMTTMMKDGVRKVLAQETTVEEIVRVMQE